MTIFYSFFVPMIVGILVYSVPILKPSIEYKQTGIICRIVGSFIAAVAGIISVIVVFQDPMMSPVWGAVFLPSIIVGIYLMSREIVLIRR